MAAYDKTSLAVLLEQLRKKRNEPPVAKDLYVLEILLREKRKRLIGSYHSLYEMICPQNTPDEKIISDLSDYLSIRTVCFWKADLPDKEEFCRRFYELAMYCIASGNIGNESIDDIIKLANCLVRSKDIYMDVVKRLIPTDMISDLFSLTEGYDPGYFSALFEDAVLAAVSVFLGALTDPLDGMEGPTNE